MASKIFIAFALLAGISSSVKATVHDAETIPSEQVVTNTGCTPAAFSDIWALRSVLNRKMRLGPRGFSLNMPDGTCLYASIDEITLVRDHPNVLAMHKSVMQQNADEIAQNGKTPSNMFVTGDALGRPGCGEYCDRVDWDCLFPCSRCLYFDTVSYVGLEGTTDTYKCGV